MTGRLAYLAYPIDAMQQDQMRAFDARLAIQRAGYAVFEPGTAWSMDAVPGDEDCRHVAEVNDYALINSSLLVTLIPNEMSSVGVPAEIRRALDLETRILMVVDSPRPSLMLRAWGHQLAAEGRGGFTDIASLRNEIRLLDVPRRVAVADLGGEV